MRLVSRKPGLQALAGSTWRQAIFVGCSTPRHGIIDVRPAIDEARQHVGEVALRVGVIELAGPSQRRHGRPADSAIIT